VYPFASAPPGIQNAGREQNKHPGIADPRREYKGLLPGPEYDFQKGDGWREDDRGNRRQDPFSSRISELKRLSGTRLPVLGFQLAYES